MGTTGVDVADLMHRATEALARPRQPGLRTQATKTSPGFWQAVVLVVMVAIIVCVSIVGASRGNGPPPPARALDTSDMASVDGSRPAGGRFMLTVVRPKGPRPDVATARASMEAAKRNGIRAALSCVDAAGRRSVSIDAGRIIGGSAGLMFALTIVDAIEPLRTDALVAGTGTIAENGAVGPISDIGLKARAASDAGAEIFLAPKAQAGEAQRAAPGLRVVGVQTLDEAVRTLGRTEGCDGPQGEET